MQNFGLASLYRRQDNPDKRMRCALTCVGFTAFGMACAWQFQNIAVVAVLSTAGFDFVHWIADIELSRRASRWGWRFAAIVLLLGVLWLVLRQGPLSVANVQAEILVRVLNGIGMIHFIYSARIWRLSDPRIRSIVIPARSSLI
jgi:hypothetical protein